MNLHERNRLIRRRVSVAMRKSGGAVFNCSAAAGRAIDRSRSGVTVDGPATYIRRNIVGTYTLLEVSRAYLSSLNGAEPLLFHQVSTD